MKTQQEKAEQDGSTKGSDAGFTIVKDAEGKECIHVTGRTPVQAKDGSRFVIAPGHRGKGLAIIPVTSTGAVGPRNAFLDPKRDARGRPPSPATEGLRDKLKQDGEAGKIGSTADYVTWYQGRAPEAKIETIRATVYRERKAALDAFSTSVKAGKLRRPAGSN